MLIHFKKNVQDPNEPPQNLTAVAIIIAATTFVFHSFGWYTTKNWHVLCESRKTMGIFTS